MFKKSVGIFGLVCSLLFATGICLAVSSDAQQEADEGNVVVEKININTASRSELIKLDGIGPVYADRIIEYRRKHGPFQRPEDIKKVKGIGQKKWEANKDVIAVE